MQVQASSAKLADISVLTSITAETKTVPLELALLLLLNVVSVVDVMSPSALLICSDIIKDVAADAMMNKAADYASITTDIATVVGEILYEDGNKALESNDITYMAEDAVDEAVGQFGVDNDDEHAVGEKIVATTDENVVEHVSHTTSHRWNPTIN